MRTFIFSCVVCVFILSCNNSGKLNEQQSELQKAYADADLKAKIKQKGFLEVKQKRDSIRLAEGYKAFANLSFGVTKKEFLIEKSKLEKKIKTMSFDEKRYSIFEDVESIYGTFTEDDRLCKITLVKSICLDDDPKSIYNSYLGAFDNIFKRLKEKYSKSDDLTEDFKCLENGRSISKSQVVFICGNRRFIKEPGEEEALLTIEYLPLMKQYLNEEKDKKNKFIRGVDSVKTKMKQDEVNEL